MGESLPPLNHALLPAKQTTLPPTPPDGDADETSPDRQPSICSSQTCAHSLSGVVAHNARLREALILSDEHVHALRASTNFYTNVVERYKRALELDCEAWHECNDELKARNARLRQRFFDERDKAEVMLRTLDAQQAWMKTTTNSGLKILLEKFCWGRHAVKHAFIGYASVGTYGGREPNAGQTFSKMKAVMKTIIEHEDYCIHCWVKHPESYEKFQLDWDEVGIEFGVAGIGIVEYGIVEFGIVEVGIMEVGIIEVGVTEVGVMDIPVSESLKRGSKYCSN
ncbi:hypothetical protein B0A49_02538 [Cryomyces minteri]|uniref:Uncharacterized protein n=1 Tax=Cryomyces minteri TaxID=331657 RepID=A0A4U0XYZ7_9PEZI|nr:hypothetical protein B0A49_02538 [Cryomyces minteri]